MSFLRSLIPFEEPPTADYYSTYILFCMESFFILNVDTVYNNRGMLIGIISKDELMILRFNVPRPITHSARRWLHFKPPLIRVKRIWASLTAIKRVPSDFPSGITVENWVIRVSLPIRTHSSCQIKRLKSQFYSWGTDLEIKIIVNWIHEQRVLHQRPNLVTP